MVDVVSEAMWVSNGIRGWENSPYYNLFKRDLIAETYIMVYEKALEMGLTPGKDLILLYTDYGIEIDNLKAKFVREEIQYTKERISQKLGIPPEEIPLAIGIEFHIYGPSNAEPWQITVTQIDSQKIEDNLSKFGQFGDVYIVELQINNDPDLKEVQRTLSMIIKTASHHPSVKGIILYEPLRRSNLFYNAINPQIFDVKSLQFDKLSFYYQLIHILLERFN